MSKQTLFLVDPCLKDFVGHHFEYDYAVAMEAVRRGFDVNVLSHLDVNTEIRAKLICTSVFRDSIWETRPFWSAISNECGVWDANRRFLCDLSRGISEKSLTCRDIVFGHMITARQILAWAWWCENLPTRETPKVVLLLRYQREFYDDPISRQAFRILENAAQTRPIRLATDSARLAAGFSSLTSLPIDVMSIPHTHNVAPAKMNLPSSGRPLRLVSLGNARDEKGFFEIIQAIELLKPDLEAGRIEFILQCNHPWPNELSAAMQVWATELPTGVTLIRQPLDTESYYCLLNQADIVLLPYWRSIYASRTSGVFVEACAAGKPVVVSSDTWMSDCLIAHGSGIACKERDANALATAVHEIVENFAKYSNAAEIQAVKWLNIHNPRTFVDQLVQEKSATKRRAAVLYPWGNLFERNSGAAVRTGLLVDYLKSQFDELLVFQVVNDGATRTFTEDNVRWESYRSTNRSKGRARAVNYTERICPPLASIVPCWNSRLSRFPLVRRVQLSLAPFTAAVSHLFRLLLSCLALIENRIRVEATRINESTRGVTRSLILFIAPKVFLERRAARFMLSQHSRFVNDAEFTFRMREIASWADVIFLSYTFWGSIVTPYCRRFGTKLVVSDLDVVADQSKQYPEIHRRTLAVELKAMSECDHAVSVSEADQKVFAQHGVKSALIPNPIDIDSCISRLDENKAKAILGKLLGADAGRSICLFVGSDFRPNVSAAEAILLMADASKSHEILYVIAGGCASKGRGSSCVRLGRISEEELAALYQSACIVINPVLTGTGTAVKTLEAMARGKVLIATSVGMRGLDVDCDAHAIVCDDLKLYPQLIADLMVDRERCRRISAAAQQFASSYDYRIIFERYMNLLETSDDTFANRRECIAA